MIPGTTIIDGLSVYTDWMPRQADLLIVQFEVLDTSTSGSVRVTAYTKASSEPDSSQQTPLEDTNGDTAYVDLDSSTPAVKKLALPTSDIKDEIRLKFVGTAGGEGTEWVHFRLLEMIWYDQA